MSRVRLRVVLSAVLALAGATGLLACDSPVDEIACQGTALVPDPDVITVEVVGTPRLAADATAVVVHGTAEHALGLTIRRITVAGVDARSTSFNFAGWSAEVPAEVLRALVAPGAELPKDVVVDVVAYDACGGTTAADEGTVSIHLAAADDEATPDGGVP